MTLLALIVLAQFGGPPTNNGGSGSAGAANAATAGRQDTGNSSLSNIDVKSPTLVSGRVPVDTGGTTQPVSTAAPLQVYVYDAGVLNVNFPATQPVSGPVTDAQLRAAAVPVSLASAPTTAVTGTFWQALQPVYVYDAGVLNVNPVGIASLPLVFIGDAGVLNVNFPATQAVSGTFWQATQPVSGTVTANAGSGTMAVSIAAMPSTPVTGTFWQATQPVSGTVTANAGSGTLAVSLASAPTTPVTGTFWQATQPVSIASMPSTPVTGTFFQATQPISAAALPLPAGAATDATLSQLLDGGVVAMGQAPGGQRMPIAIDPGGVQYVFVVPTPPLNPFLPRCNPVRRTGCQP